MPSEPEQQQSKPSSTPVIAGAAAVPSSQDPPESPVKSVTASETTDPAPLTPRPGTVTPPGQLSEKEPSSPSVPLVAVATLPSQPVASVPAAALVQQQQLPSPIQSPIQSPLSPSNPPAAAAVASPRTTTPPPKTVPTLCINPNKATFTTAGGTSKHLMINKSADRLAIKIRSSNNFFFRVNPVYSFLDCNAVNELEVIRLIGGGAKQDKLQVIYVTCSENDTDPTKLFGLRAKVRSVILPISTTSASTL